MSGRSASSQARAIGTSAGKARRTARYWNDKNGPAKEIQTRFSCIDIVGTCASVRLDADIWTGHRFTDFFNLVKFDGQSKIISKVF